MDYLKQVCRYLSYILRHKYFVFVAGRKVGTPLWRLLIHDWTKFLPSEFGPYRRFFYPTDEERLLMEGDSFLSNVAFKSFNRAWLLHQRRNKHHWQYWCLLEDKPSQPTFFVSNNKVSGRMIGDRECLAMPYGYLREMIADWMGAGRAITGKWEVGEWYKKNRNNILLHPDSRILVEGLLNRYCDASIPPPDTNTVYYDEIDPALVGLVAQKLEKGSSFRVGRAVYRNEADREKGS